MNKTALLFGVGASLILAAGTASAAGSCGAEVAALQQKLGMEDSANATIGATDPGVQQPSPSASVDSSTGATASPADDQIADTGDDANATIGAADPGVQQPAPEANATTGTSTITDGSSTTTADSSSSSSSSSTMPSGTVEETSRVGDLNTSAGGHAEAITALKKAQLAADAGDENACMTELGTAKAALGVE